MFTHPKYKFLLAIIVVAVLALVFYFTPPFYKRAGFIGNKGGDISDIPSESPLVFIFPSPSDSPAVTSKPSASPKPIMTKIPLPTSDSRTTFIDEQVPWPLLLGDASCELKGEIKFLNHNTYDNQDAMFVYKGIDHPARNIFWTVTPEDDLSVGPNIFSKIPLPDGSSLLGVILPENPKYTKYELTVKIQYGRLVDEKGNFVIAGGNVKVFEKQCVGKTTIILP